jgi:hypothetical protein
MPGWLTDFMKLLGFSTPLIYAGATYGFFLWLDKKASRPAKKAISGWLMPKQYDRAGTAIAILELFDRAYTHPLLTWRTFVRSALITYLVTGVILYSSGFTFSADISRAEHYIDWPLKIFTMSLFVVNTLSDYVALFMIRYFLANKYINPFLALVIGPGIGVLFVVFCISVRALIFIFSITLEAHASIPPMSNNWGLILFLMMNKIFLMTSVGALLVHLWLPFFALCVGLLKGLNYLLLAAHTAQWFLKRGKDHPLEAVGFVAAPLVFLGVVAFQVFPSK